MNLMSYSTSSIKIMDGKGLTNLYKDIESQTDFAKGAILEELFRSKKWLEVDESITTWDVYCKEILSLTDTTVKSLRDHFIFLSGKTENNSVSAELQLNLKTKEHTQPLKNLDDEEIIDVLEIANETKEDEVATPKEIKETVSIYQEVKKENPTATHEEVIEETIKKKTVIATLHTGDNESYTPLQYVESARLVMGGINVDPASNDYAQSKINADTYFTESNSGLDKDWNGNVWINPPYAYPLIGTFIDKLISEIESGNCVSAVLLTNNSADTKWFHKAARYSSAICMTKGRINFYKADDSTTSPTNGQTFFYFGDDNKEFAKEFKKYGMIVEVVEDAD